MVALQKSLDCDARQPAVALQLAEACEELDRDPEAFAAARHALALEPYSAEGHRRMASLYGRKGDQLNQATAFYNVGESLRREQRTSEAIAALEEALRLHPAHGKAAHALACLTGRTPCTAPRDYVVDLFNGYADRFDAHLEQLEYRVPELLRAALGRLLPPGRQAGRVLDLGCGSGRGGALFRDLATELSGVDLAPRMIETARQRGVYDTLWVGDVREVSRTNPGPYQLLLATDVFIYVGALEEVFAEAARLCAPGGWFAFSVEEGASGYVLRESGRFAHAATYWKKLAEGNGFAVVVDEAIPIRLHEGQPIPGRLGVLQRL